jgi:hypothetical protein
VSESRKLAAILIGAAGGGEDDELKRLRERVRCSSLVDWPVYPRLAHTMRASNDAQCGAPFGNPRRFPFAFRTGAGR